MPLLRIKEQLKVVRKLSCFWDEKTKNFVKIIFSINVDSSNENRGDIIQGNGGN